MDKDLYWKFIRAINMSYDICCTCAYYNLHTHMCENEFAEEADIMEPDEGCSLWTAS